MAINYAQVAKLENNPLRKGIITNLLRDSRVLEWMPFENVNSLSSVAVRWTNLPDVAFRKINTGYTASEGDVEQVYESVYGFGGDIEIDRVFDKLGNMIQDPKALQIDMKTKAMALYFNYYLIHGDHTADADGFEGLQVRIDNMPTSQKVRASSTTDILDPTASAGNARRFLDKWEEAHYKANSGQVNVILMNQGLYYGFGRALRYIGTSAGSLLDVTKDSFDREILTYKGAKFVDMGLRADQSTEIITNAETAEDGGTDATSVYFVSFGMDNGITGIQLSDMETYDPLDGGERETKPTKLIRIDWWCGLAGFGSYGATRLHNIETPASWT